MKIFLVLMAIACSLSCCALSPLSDGDHDVQFIQIFYHSGLLDELDTFHGTYQKDLIPGTAITKMWLTTREQEIILTKAEQMNLFSFIDTLYLYPPSNFGFQQPDLGPQVIRVK